MTDQEKALRNQNTPYNQIVLINTLEIADVPLSRSFLFSCPVLDRNPEPFTEADFTRILQPFVDAGTIAQVENSYVLTERGTSILNTLAEFGLNLALAAEGGAKYENDPIRQDERKRFLEAMKKGYVPLSKTD